MEEKQFFDFKNEENFNLDDEYSKLFNGEEFKIQNSNDEKLKDAENIIAEYGAKYVENISMQKYEQTFLNLSEFLVKFRVDSDEVINMTSADRDKLFGYGKSLFTFYQERYSNLDFNFEMSVKEWRYVEHTLVRKIPYNGQELFNYWELYMKFIKPTKDLVDKLPKQLDMFMPVISIQSLVLLSHLLMKNEEKASTESFHHFRTVLTEIAKMTKLFNAYGVILERVTKRFNNWVTALNTMDGYNNDNRVDMNQNELQ